MDAAKPSTAQIHHICDRQNLIALTRARRLGLEPVYAMERLDMYWVHVTEGVEGAECTSYSVEPHKDGTWELCRQFGPGTPWARRVALALFTGSAEEAQQARWIASLVAGGYFANDFETEECPHCGHWFAAGTTHAHRRQGDLILPHSHKMHRALLAAGFQPSWHPAHVEKPSLEEQGLL